MTDPIYGNVFDHHSVVYEMENGVRIYAFCRTTEGCFNDTSSLVFGTKGRASILTARSGARKPGAGRAMQPLQVEHDILFKGIAPASPSTTATSWPAAP
jgi:hypothetical protein